MGCTNYRTNDSTNDNFGDGFGDYDGGGANVENCRISGQRDSGGGDSGKVVVLHQSIRG